MERPGGRFGPAREATGNRHIRSHGASQSDTHHCECGKTAVKSGWDFFFFPFVKINRSL